VDYKINRQVGNSANLRKAPYFKGLFVCPVVCIALLVGRFYATRPHFSRFTMHHDFIFRMAFNDLASVLSWLHSL